MATTKTAPRSGERLAGACHGGSDDGFGWSMHPAVVGSVVAAVALIVSLCAITVPVAAFAPTPTAAPDIVRVDVDTGNQLTVVVSHGDPQPDEYLYRVFWKQNGSFFEVARTDAPSGQQLEVLVDNAALSTNAVGEVAVQACELGNDANCTASTVVGPIALSVPYNVLGAAAGTAATFDWSYADAAGGDLVEFELFRRVVGGAWQSVDSVPSDVRSYTFEDLVARTEYEVGVRAVQSSANPLVHSITQTDVVSIEAAAGQPSIDAVLIPGSSSYEISISDPDTTGDRTYRITTADANASPLATQETVMAGSAPADPITVTFPSESSNQLRTVTVEVCPSGSNCSNAVSVVIAVSVPYDVSAANATISTIDLDWSYWRFDDAPFVGYEVVHRLAGTDDWSTPIEISDDADTVVTVPGLDPDTSYELAVRTIQNANPFVASSYQITDPVRTQGVVVGGDGWNPLRAATEAGAEVYREPNPAGALRVDDDGNEQYLSIRAAIEDANRGDTILVFDGVYSESLGSIDKAITIRAASGATPVVTGADERPKDAGWEPDDNVNLTRLNVGALIPGPDEEGYDIIDEFQLGGTADPAAGYLEQLAYQRPGDAADEFRQLRQVLSKSGVEADPMGSFFYHRDWEYIYVSDQLFDAASTFWLTRPHNEGQPDDSASGVRFETGSDGSAIHGIRFTMFSPFHTNIGGVVEIQGRGGESRVDDITITHVTVDSSAATGINLQHGTGITLEHVTADANGARGLSANNIRLGGNGHGLAIRWSRFDKNNVSGFEFDIGGCNNGNSCALAGAKITNTYDLEVAFNRFANNRSTGFWCDLDCRNTVLVGNHVQGNERHGIYYEVSSFGTIASNTIVGHNGNDDKGIKISGSRHVDVYRNTLYDNEVQIEIPSDPRNKFPVAGSDIFDVDIRANLFAERSSPGDPQYLLSELNPGPPEPPLDERLEAFSDNGYALALQSTRRFSVSLGACCDTPQDFFDESDGEYAVGATSAAPRSNPSEVFAAPQAFDYSLVDPVLLAARGAPMPSAAIGPNLIEQQPQPGVGAAYN